MMEDHRRLEEHSDDGEHGQTAVGQPTGPTFFDRGHVQEEWIKREFM